MYETFIHFIIQPNFLDGTIGGHSDVFEVVEQIKNQIRYMYAARMLARNFTAIRASIKGRFDR